MTKTPPIPETLPYGEGIYHRRIRLSSGAGFVSGELEDDFHHFRVRLTHDGEKLVRVEGEALRYPWSTCRGATMPLQGLRGLRLVARVTAPAREHDPHAHCTHLFDLASLAFTHAAAGRDTRLYEIQVPDRIEDRTHPTLRCDGVEILSWTIKGRRITDPPPFAGRSLAKGFVSWADAELDPDTAEAAIVLRRACAISIGRVFPLDKIENSNDLASHTLGACYTFSPGVIEEGKRMLGSTFEFTHTPERLLS